MDLHRQGLAPNDFSSLAKRFDLGGVLDLVPIVKNGQWTDCMALVTEAGRFCLKVYPYKNPEQLKRIEKVLALQEQMAELGVPCQVPRKSANDKYIFGFRHGYVAIFPFIMGDDVLDVRTPVAPYLGLAAASIHRCTAGMIAPCSMIPSVDHFIDKAISSWDSQLPSPIRDMIDWIKNALAAITLLDTSRKGLIHSDLHARNVLVGYDDTIQIVDFANCEWAPFAKDIGIALFYVVEHEWNTLGISAISQFFSSYQKVRSLTESETHDAYQHMRLKALHFLSWQILRSSRGQVPVTEVEKAVKLARLIDDITMDGHSSA